MDERALFQTRCDIPKPERTVIADGGQHFTVRAERDRLNWPRVSVQNPQFASRCHLPNLDFPVAATGNQDLFVGTEDALIDDIGMTIKLAQESSTCHIPQFDRAVEVARNQRPPVTAESKAEDSSRRFLRRRKIVCRGCLSRTGTQSQQQCE